MKKMKSFVIAAAITAVAVVPVFASISGLVSDTTNSEVTGVTDVTDQEYLKGDVDNNKEIQLEDARLALRQALDLIVLDEKAMKAADVNEDGDVKLDDAQQILKMALDLIDHFTTVK